MARYVALAFFLFLSPLPSSYATGNIGCLFSETLCNQEKEWCFDDYAFGRCLPLYGNLHEENMFRYDLGAEELHMLEKEMQRLFMLGYRWSHTYTQCVLQVLLGAIRENVEIDVSSCNAELDQDLEGALKAIEGEEVEHIDPRNLAIVRFKPSVGDPHSDYADEFYFPPVNEMLPPYRPNLGDEEDDTEGKIKDEEIPSDNLDRAANLVSDEERTPPSPNTIQSKQIGSGHQEIQPEESGPEQKNSFNSMYTTPQDLPVTMFFDDDFGYGRTLDDFDYDKGYNMPRELPASLYPVYEKRNNLLVDSQSDPEEVPTDLSMSTLVRKLLRRNSFSGRDLGQIAKMLTNIRHGVREGTGPRNHVMGEPIYYPTENEAQVFDYGDSRFRVTADDFYNRPPPLNSFYDEKGMSSNRHNSVPGYVPYISPYPHDAKTSAKSQLPELSPPKQDTMYISDDIHPRYAPPTQSANEESFHGFSRFESPMENGNAEEKTYYDNSIARFDDIGKPLQGVEQQQSPNDWNSYQWPMDDGSNQDHYYRSSPDYENRFSANLGDQMYAMPPPDYPHYSYYGPYQAPYNYDYVNYDYVDYRDSIPPMQKNVKKDEEGGDYVNMMNAPYYLERNERFDEKKPGPPFKQLKEEPNFLYGSVNNAKMPEPESLPGGGDWYKPMTNWLQSNDRSYLLMSPGGPFYEQNDEMSMSGPMLGSDPVHTDEAVVDKAVDGSLIQSDEGQKENLPQAERHVGGKGFPTGEQVLHQHAIPLEDSYVYITVKGDSLDKQRAYMMVNAILSYAGINAKLDEENISVNKNVVAFQLPENDKKITPGQLAEQIEELRPQILKNYQVEIIQSAVGNKNALSGVVYQANDRHMEAAAAIVCGVCGALLVSATAVFLLRRHARSKAKLQGITAHDTEASKDYQDLCRARMATRSDGKDTTGSAPGHAQAVAHTQSTHASGQRISSLSKESDNGNNSPSSRSSTSSWSEEPVISNMDISTGHMVLSYMEDHLRNKDRLEQEWVELCAYEAEPCSCSYALKPDQAKKNRYPDCITYDHNRVMLNEHTNISGSSYINASSITDHDPRNPAYIATQGPLTSTTADFWQLVWEQGSVVIVMLTRLTENGQTMCHRYWPEEGSELYHIYEVHLVSEHIWCDDYLVRSFYLKNVRTGETRTVTQFHFLSWPESGTPASTKALLEFRRKVNKSYRGRSCPIIVHCSDGVGRAGTYCLIDMVLNRMVKGSKEIDIAATLEHIRDQRPLMVKTKSQFEFVLMAVAEEVHAILKALPQ